MNFSALLAGLVWGAAITLPFLVQAEPPRPILDMSAFDEPAVKVGVSVTAPSVNTRRAARSPAAAGMDAVWPPIHPGSAQTGFEADIFKNSIGALSETISIWAEWPVLGGQDALFGRLYLGGAVGLARYQGLVDDAEGPGLPTFASFMPLIAAQATWLVTEQLEMRMRASPIGGDADFVVGWQLLMRL